MNTKPVAIERKTYRNGTEISVCNTIASCPEADFAMALMEKIGIISCEVDGEDSAGRQKVRLLAPDEVVTRCCDIAKAAFKQFEENDWLIAIPLPKVADEEKVS